MRKILIVLTTVFFILLLLKLVNIREAIVLISAANTPLVILAIIAGVFQTYLAAFRMKVLVSIITKIKISYFFWMGYLTSLVSTVFPFFVGGLSFAFLLSRKIKSSYTKAFGIALADFLFGISTILVLGAISLFFFGSKKLVLTAHIDFERLILIILLVLGASAAPFFIGKKVAYLESIFSEVKKGIVLFSNSKLILTEALLLTLPITLLHFISLYLFFLALGIKPNFVEFILAASLLSILNLIPGAIAKIGQYETFGVLTLPYLLSLDKNVVFSVLLLQHAVSLVLIVVFGAISAYYLKEDFVNLRKIIIKIP